MHLNKRSGYIEGYFGRTLTWDERSGLLDHLSDLGMNTYLLGPKEDPYHRVKWKVPYPVEEKQNIKDLAGKGQRLGVDLVPSLAPGLSFDYLSGDDYAIMLNKIILFFNMNINTVALLMDDVLPTLPGNCQDIFTSLGEAHGKLLVKLYSDLKTVNSNVELWFCPTIYTDQFVTGKAVHCDYIKDLAAQIPREVTLIWTGPKVVSELINSESCGDVFNLFHGNVIFWDNYYANDYCPFRLFTGSFQGRDPEIIESSRGILLNPTGLYHTDKLLLSLVSDFLKTGISDEDSWNRIADYYNIHPYLKSYKRFFWSPFTTFSEDDFLEISRIDPAEFYENVIVKWQNPLRLEWYSYLYGLYLDMQMLGYTEKPDKRWFFNRYPACVASRLIKK